MTVRFFPGAKSQKTRLIAGFLKEFKVDYELVHAEDTTSHTFHLGTDPAVEVEGRMFVDPNEDALKKIFHVK